nr:low-density lipoprotein receptor-related protein 4-like [Lytechinus pictus]
MTGLNRETVRAGLEDLMDIKVFHHNRPTRTSPCDVNNGGCSHLCLLSSSPEGFTCACPTGIMLGDDGFTCNQDLDKFLVFAHKTDVRIVSLEPASCTGLLIKDHPYKSCGQADGSDVETVLDTLFGLVEDPWTLCVQKLYWTGMSRKRIE